MAKNKESVQQIKIPVYFTIPEQQKIDIFTFSNMNYQLQSQADVYNKRSSDTKISIQVGTTKQERVLIDYIKHSPLSLGGEDGLLLEISTSSLYQVEYEKGIIEKYYLHLTPLSYNNNSLQYTYWRVLLYALPQTKEKAIVQMTQTIMSSLFNESMISLESYAVQNQIKTALEICSLTITYTLNHGVNASSRIQNLEPYLVNSKSSITQIEKYSSIPSQCAIDSYLDEEWVKLFKRRTLNFDFGNQKSLTVEQEHKGGEIKEKFEKVNYFQYEISHEDWEKNDCCTPSYIKEIMEEAIEYIKQ